MNRGKRSLVILLIISIIAVGALGLKSHGVHVLGPVHGGLPVLGVPIFFWNV